MERLKDARDRQLQARLAHERVVRPADGHPQAQLDIVEDDGDAAIYTHLGLTFLCERLPYSNLQSWYAGDGNLSTRFDGVTIIPRWLTVRRPADSRSSGR